MQGLASLVMKPVEESDLSPMDTSVSAMAVLLPAYHWLLVRLPSLPLFECVKMNICSDLRHVSVIDFVVQFASLLSVPLIVAQFFCCGIEYVWVQNSFPQVSFYGVI